MDRGEGIPFEGNYSSWLDQKRRRLEVEEKQASKRQKVLQHELEWIRMNPKGRHAKSKARISSYEQMLSEEHGLPEGMLRALKAEIEILFFDDLSDNIASARACGWSAEQIDHTGDTARQMAEHLGRHGVL